MLWTWMIKKKYTQLFRFVVVNKIPQTIWLSVFQRSALAYNHNDSSLDGGLNRMNVGISTTSTTSRSTSKSSGAIYRPEGYLHNHSTSTSTNIPSAGIPANAGIPPYGYDSSLFHNKAPDGKYLKLTYEKKLCFASAKFYSSMKFLLVRRVNVIEI